MCVHFHAHVHVCVRACVRAHGPVAVPPCTPTALPLPLPHLLQGTGEGNASTRFSDGLTTPFTVSSPFHHSRLNTASSFATGLTPTSSAAPYGEGLGFRVRV